MRLCASSCAGSVKLEGLNKPISAFLVIWWVVLFAILPWGNRPVENPEVGHAASAPEKPRLLLKFAVTTVIAGILFGLLLWVIEAELISIRDYNF